MNTQALTSHSVSRFSTPGMGDGGRSISAFGLVCADGRSLAAHWIEPAGGVAHAVTVIHPALGVPQRFYRAFAEWLAARGHAVLTYDYRGIGDSRRGPVRAETATQRDWALRDMPAALAAAEARRTAGGVRLPLLLVGHSFGGHGLAFAEGAERADAVLTIASQEAEFRHWPGHSRYVARFFFSAWLPAWTRIAGHLPAWAMGPGAHALPRGVALDWSRWGLTPGYLFGDAQMRPHALASAIGAPVHLWSIDDDFFFGPRQAVDALAARFRNAAVQRHHLHPRDVGLAKIGHFGMFRRDAGAAIWPRWMAAIEQAVPALKPRG